MKLEEIWIVVALLNGAMLIGWLVWFIRLKVQQGMTESVKERHRKRDVIRETFRANSFGIASKQGAQWRGLCALVLTKKELAIHRAVPAAQYLVPIDKITGLKKTKIHAGKASTRDLLKVEFKSEGKVDSIALMVSDLDEWIAAIEAERKRCLQAQVEAVAGAVG